MKPGPAERVPEARPVRHRLLCINSNPIKSSIQHTPRLTVSARAP